METIKREDIQIISRHSNWSESGIDTTLKEEIYNNKAAWQQFLRLFFISLGVGFTTAGIVFFFAFNWEDLHKFIKVGLVEGLIVGTTLFVIFSKISLDIKNILLTAAALLVGVLFAVFGQIYQTGADAYDFFLGWTLCITLWVLISNFAPLWLVFITLINTTIVLYSNQVAQDWSEVFVCTLLFLINVLFLASSLSIPKILQGVKPPTWFTNLLAIAAISFSTIGIVIGIFSEKQTAFFSLIGIAAILYTIGIWHGLKERNAFYLSVIPLSCVIIITAFLIEISTNAGMFLFISLFVIASVTLLIKNLIDLQKQWKN